ncbi:TadE/TadG family type IV pilus assembly protein [Paenibacillus oleatilyticus]
MRFIHKQLFVITARRFFAGHSGQFTIEASLTLPVILIATLLLIFLSLFAYQQASVHYTAALTADRTAYIWDNSRKDPVTGSVGLGQTDGLYWRLTTDHLMNLFSFLLPISPASVQLPVSGHAAGQSGPAGKLSRAAGSLPGQLRGEIDYTNHGFLRYVRVALEKKFHFPSFAQNFWGKEADVETSSKSYVIDPIETIRLTDLTRTFIGEIQGRIKPKDALKTMVDPKTSVKEPVKITSEIEAAEHLRGLVGGISKKFNLTPETVRVVDALDSSGVAHQAYYTFNEKNLREQMAKDVELLRQGTQIKGVVWHFFKVSKNDKMKLTQGLKRELEQKGIVVVLHE